MATIREKKQHVAAEVRKPHRIHHCHARDCNTRVPPAYFMCARHWRMVPRDLQKEVWAQYEPGQEQGTAEVSEAYLEVTTKAIEAVAKKEAGL